MWQSSLLLQPLSSALQRFLHTDTNHKVSLWLIVRQFPLIKIWNAWLPLKQAELNPSLLLIFLLLFLHLLLLFSLLVSVAGLSTFVWRKMLHTGFWWSSWLQVTPALARPVVPLSHWEVVESRQAGARREEWGWGWGGVRWKRQSLIVYMWALVLSWRVHSSWVGFGKCSGSGLCPSPRPLKAWRSCAELRCKSCLRSWCENTEDNKSINSISALLLWLMELRHWIHGTFCWNAAGCLFPPKAICCNRDVQSGLQVTPEYICFRLWHCITSEMEWWSHIHVWVALILKGSY